MTLGDFARKHKELFWSTKSYDTLDERVVVESILNHGDWDAVQELITLLGIQRTAEVFREWSRSDRPRTNFYPQTTAYFNRYFDRYA